jgi:unsaturated rhamnogalacturonyl hydrolase
MKKVCLLTGALLVSYANSLYCQTEANTWSVKFSNAIAGRYKPNINKMTGKGWEYSNTIILAGMEKVYNQVKTASTQTSYYNYIKAYVDAYVNADGTIPQSKIMSALGLDGSHPGLLCLFLYQQTGQSKYQLAAKHIRDTLMLKSIGYPRTPEGGFWHRNDAKNYKNVELLDGIYMAQPFLARYGYVFKDSAATDTAVDQTIIMYNRNYNKTTHLINHAFDYDKKTYPWANPSTGVSYEVWARGMGWYMLDLIEVLKYVPHSHPKYAQLVTILNNLALGIKNYQDASTGLWYCIVDSPKTASKNYIETSGSGMFIYSLKTAIDSGYISSATYLPVVNTAWTGYQKYIKTYSGSINGYANGPQITSFTPAQGVENNYAAYVSSGPVSVPTASGTQHPHGYAATLMAASAMEFPLTTTTLVKSLSLSADATATSVTLSWQNENDIQVDRYEIQKLNDQKSYTTALTVKSNHSGSYNWIDNNSKEPGKIIYYLIKAVSTDSSVEYSQPVPVKYINSNGMSLQIYPNPASKELIHLAFVNCTAGNYILRVVNSQGKLIMVKQLTISTEGSYLQSIVLPQGTPPGMYFIQLQGNNFNTTKNLFVE